MESSLPLSAVLITYNAARVLPECLASLAFADEIVVIDSGSEDGTRAMVVAAGGRVIDHPWSGFGAQKQFAVLQAKYDWVLCVDADERVPESLARAIQAALRAPLASAYEFPRSNFFMGRYLTHGEGYPDWSLRLFDRRHAQWSNDAVHEKVECDAPVARISDAGALLHHSADSISDYWAKQNRYTTLQAEALFARGARAPLARMLAAPLLRFLKFYIVRGGFLDGIPGLVHISIGCSNSFMKYAKLRELQRLSS
jgi:glycosyltransferase involved in cell wall biosynthesis